MFRTLTAVALALGIASPLHAQTAADAIEDVISSQLDAFRAKDVEEAFSYASPDIKELFETPERFATMVRSGYPMVWAPGRVEYLDLAERRGGMVQTVMIADSDGALHTLAYRMVETERGWQINGVRILETGQVGV